MPSIHTFSGFTGWSGRLRPARRRSAILPAQAGFDGHDVLRDGWSTDPQAITTTIDLASGLAFTRAEQFRALMGLTTGVLVVDPLGLSWPSCIVLDAVSTHDLTITGLVRVTTTWSLLPATTLP
jgi:hypothetical protein